MGTEKRVGSAQDVANMIVSGNEQRTLQSAATYTGASTVRVTVTSAQLSAAFVLDVTVAPSDSAATVAGKIRTALGAEATITSKFTVGGSSATVSLTSIALLANDTTLNIATANGTSVGLTAAPTSAHTTPGVADTTAQVETATVAGTIAASTTILGNAVTEIGHFKQAAILLVLTDAAAAAGDTLDCYVDTSYDGGTTWLNAVHFTQILGNGADSISIVAVLDPGGAPGTAVVATTSDASAGAVRPTLFGNALRLRHVIADGGAHGQSFTFGATVFLKA